MKDNLQTIIAQLPIIWRHYVGALRATCCAQQCLPVTMQDVIQRWKTKFRECMSFVHVNVVLMCKRFLPSKTVKTSWIRRNPIGRLETVPSQRGCLACEEIQRLFNTVCGFSAAYKLLSVVVGSDIHTLNSSNHVVLKMHHKLYPRINNLQYLFIPLVLFRLIYSAFWFQ